MPQADDRDWPTIEAELQAEQEAKFRKKWEEHNTSQGGVLPLQPRPLRSGSYLTALTIVEENRLNILGDRQLRMNEMTGRVEFGRDIYADEHTSFIRGEIERHFSAGEDDLGPKGLKLSIADVDAACRQVAAANAYHPVRIYLASLKWDGVERISASCEDLLGAGRTPLNQALMRRFFVSAVARVFDPGCKVDTMLILVGPQGKLKSTFFRTLASRRWFIDTPIDISKKDAFQQLRVAWIIEWAELEALFRARDATAVKAFISSPVDTYRASHERNVMSVERSSVFVGSTNNDEFLTDETGNRRFWPMRNGEINIPLTLEQRDQLWAEAVAIYQAARTCALCQSHPDQRCGVHRWWLTQEEEALLVSVHGEHRVRDAWEDCVLGWVGSYMVPFTTADVLTKALEKPKGQWTRADEMRVSKILKAAGWERKTDPGETTTKKWRRVAS